MGSSFWSCLVTILNLSKRGSSSLLLFFFRRPFSLGLLLLWSPFLFLRCSWRWSRVVTRGIRSWWAARRWWSFPFPSCFAFFRLGRDLAITARDFLHSSLCYIFTVRKKGFIMTSWWWNISNFLRFLHYYEKIKWGPATCLPKREWNVIAE